jgi:hypothetical protein
LRGKGRFETATGDAAFVIKGADGARMRAGRKGATGPIGLGFRSFKGGGVLVGVVLDRGEPGIVVSTFLPTAGRRG